MAEKTDSTKKADLAKLATLQKEYDKLKVDVPHEADGTKQRGLLTRKGEVTREMDVIKRKHDLPGDFNAATAAAEDGGDAPAPDASENPVADLNATDAVAAVGHMRSKDKVQAVADNDTRASVKEAAAARLASL